MPEDPRSLSYIMGINRRNLELIFPHNPRHGFPVVDDKIRTKDLLRSIGITTPKTLRVVGNFLEIDRSIQALKVESSFVIKPSRGRAGGGVLLVKRDPLGQWRSPSGRSVSDEQLRKHLGDILFGVYSFGRMDDRALVEKRVEQHDFFQSLYDGGIADIRLILFHTRPVMAMLRIPTSTSDGKANLHQGAMGVQVDLDTGVTGDGFWRGRRLNSHPDTKAPIRGLTVPFWKEILETSPKAAAAVPLAYIGIDLVIDRNEGPLVLELNARPGLQIQVINHSGLAPRLFDGTPRRPS
jgi:alpha-L-glutamate ligase-like protein